MVFSNTAIDLQNIPAAEDVPLQPFHLSFKKVLWVEWAITTFILLALAIGAILLTKRMQMPWRLLLPLAPVVLVSGIHAFSIIKSFSYMAYAVRERDVLLQKGWLVRRLRIAPFNRIQNCSVQSGPLERRWSLASLTVYTAGNDSADMRISGLTQTEADNLRRFILQQIHAEPDGVN